MNGILKEIVDYKREFVAGAKRRVPQTDMEAMAHDAPSPRGFAEALAGPGCALIAEIKTASPSKGLIREGIDPREVAGIYVRNGASAISVLTDERFFRGSLDRLRHVRDTVDLPLLRKDFVIDPYQVYEARAAGADAVLLIAACLDGPLMEDLMGCASLLGLDTLVEVHDRSELARAAKLNTRMVGINNRDLATFETSLETTAALAADVPGHAFLVSESGIFTAADVRQVHSYGADAVLVGESIIRADDIGEKVRELARAAPA